MDKKKKILFYAVSPMNYAVFSTIHRKLEQDPRIEITFTSKFEGSKNPDRLYRDVLGLINVNLLNFRLAGLKRFDLYISPDIMMAGKRCSFKVHMFHGASFKGKAYSDKVYQFDKLFLIGEYMRSKFVSDGLLKEDDKRIEKVGMPKLDRFFDGSLNREKILEPMGLDPKIPTVIYAPTWSQQSSLYTVGEALISELSHEGLNVLVKIHDHSYDLNRNPVDWREKLAPLEKGKTRIIKDYDIVPYLFASDLLITDLSSVSNEFALLDRPIVFIDTPGLLERYKNTVDLEVWGRKSGYTVETIPQIKSAVQKGIENPAEHSEVRRRLAENLFYNPGKATEKAVSSIYRYLELDE
ncbi:MAG: CDP-glycerol glycerophosphotransferase family protein [Candidatus Schekmanbacteria bacterium]|nr:CDP-glycerol glycerophosphotransferase family protein [Candidatus Schekmanbacteria bacterium]